MQITIEDVQYNLPASLMDITLQQRIDFDKQYGKDIREKLKAITEAKESITREMDFTEYTLDLACKTLSFFGKIPLDIIQNTNITEVLEVYHRVMRAMTDEVNFNDPDFQLVTVFHWMNEEWVIHPPVLKNNSQMTYGEFIDSKQIVQDLYELGEQKWEALLALSSIYFRKKNEAYSESLSNVEEPRYNLLKSLPLEYALHVGFFLSASLLSFEMASLFSGRLKPSPADKSVSI